MAFQHPTLLHLVACTDERLAAASPSPAWTWPALTCIHVGHGYLTMNPSKPVVKTFLKTISSCTNLVELNVVMNYIQDEGLAALVGALKALSSFKWLIVWGNPCAGLQPKPGLIKKLVEDKDPFASKIVWAQPGHVVSRYWFNLVNQYPDKDSEIVREEIGDRFYEYYFRNMTIADAFFSFFQGAQPAMWNQCKQDIEALGEPVARTSTEAFVVLFKFSKENHLINPFWALELAHRAMSGRGFLAKNAYLSKAFASIAIAFSAPFGLPAASAFLDEHQDEFDKVDRQAPSGPLMPSTAMLLQNATPVGPLARLLTVLSFNSEAELRQFATFEEAEMYVVLPAERMALRRLFGISAHSGSTS